MRVSGWTVCGVCLALLLGSMRSVAQTPIAANTAAELHAMAQQAGVIFAGSVVAVRQSGSSVEIDFAVEDAVRGVNGGAYTLREWAGLWAGGAQPLRLGQRYLMLLHGTGATGLSAPVGGADGAVPISGGADGMEVDLRWIGARIVRPLQYRRTVQLTALPGAVHPEAANVATADMVVTQPESTAGSYSQVLGMLRDWEKDRDDAR